MIWILAILGAVVFFGKKAGATVASTMGVTSGQSYGRDPSTSLPSTPVDSNNAPYTTPGNVPVRPASPLNVNFRSLAVQAGAIFQVPRSPANAISSIHVPVELRPQGSIPGQ